MGPLAVAVVGFLAVLIVLTVLGAYAMRWSIGVTIGARHQAIQHIVETAQVPTEWRATHDRRIERLKRGGADAERLQKAGEQAQRDYLRRLDKLIDYAQKTRLMADEETREDVLARLRAARAEWGASSPLAPLPGLGEGTGRG